MDKVVTPPSHTDRDVVTIGIRRLLARVRDVMAGPGDAQNRLDKIVEVVASDMVAEVCSIYVRRAGDVLELFATKGLKVSAVHETRLRVGEGVIGDIAEKAVPLSLSDAPSHPKFAYRPETGEDLYSSMMGVPVLRNGRVIGVLAVQNRTSRNYINEEIETLQTVAMILAEMIASGALVGKEELRHVDGIGLKPLRLEGMRLNGGIGLGVAVFHQANIRVEKVVAENAAIERERLAVASSQMHGSLDDLLEHKAFKGGGEHQDILEAYRMIAEDAGWFKKIEAAIDTGLTAEAAVEKVQNDIRTRMKLVRDPYLRERVHDLDDLANRLMAHLFHGEDITASNQLPEHAILIARTMGPAQLLDYDSSRLRGIVLEEGQPTSHVAIVARALEIPVVGQVRDVLERIEEGDPVIVDADHTQIFIRPGEEVHAAVRKSIRDLAEQKATYQKIRNLPALTTDGVSVDLSINAGLMVDMAHLVESGAHGVGLFRTEIPFMVRSKFPSVSEQAQLYGRVMDSAGDKPVTFRTLDIGGDKILPYWKHYEEDNPAMGWRAIRISMDRPAVLRQQLRGLIRGAAGRPLSVLFPMVAEIMEYRAAREMVNIELAREEKIGGILPSSIEVGVMIEVPSLIYQLDTLLEEVDFVSIGSNDLLQFLFAADRGNSRVAGRYDEMSPIFLKVVKQIVDACQEANVPCTLCGEMAANPVDAMALIGLGVRRMSMAPSAIGGVKTMIRSLSMQDIEAYMKVMLDANEHSLRGKLKDFASDHGVEVK